MTATTHVESLDRSLHAAVRDRLPPNGAAQLAAQLPTLVRGVYYDGWSPHNKAPATSPPRGSGEPPA